MGKMLSKLKAFLSNFFAFIIKYTLGVFALFVWNQTGKDLMEVNLENKHLYCELWNEGGIFLYEEICCASERKLKPVFWKGFCMKTMTEGRNCFSDLLFKRYVVMDFILHVNKF